MTGISDENKDGYLIKEFAGNVEVGERQITDGLEISISNDKVSLLKIQLGSILPTRFVLEQNFPNPFNPVTTIKYEIPSKATVQLNIYNTLGEVILVLVNEEKPVGYYEIEFDASSFASGVYFYRIQAGDFIETKKMILMK
ncbi:MAG: T9SS type A sorting domain-containing protein [Bacteroidetes bacterium]|nr:T9SS type A sorting domain-containing protein [Bacteroidota bacterium]